MFLFSIFVQFRALRENKSSPGDELRQCGGSLVDITIVNRGEWLGSLAKFFVLCFCSLFLDMTLHKHNTS